MGWLGSRDRRRGPRSPGQERDRKQVPTYIVERDAPPHRPVPFWEHWQRKAAAVVQRVRVDAYPDHLRPFEDMEPPSDEPAPPEPVSPAVAERLPRPDRHEPPIRVVVYRGRKGRAVNIAPFRWDRDDLWPRSFLTTIGVLVNEAIETLRREDEGQGLVEYALILALVAIVAIVALLFIGGQLTALLSHIGASV